MEEGLGDGGFRFDGVEVVVGTGHYVKGAGDAGLLQSPGVGDVLVMEQVVGADADPCGRKAGEVVVAGRRGQRGTLPSEAVAPR